MPVMPGQLEGKVAVITGTGNGIARDIALRFAAEGARIVGCDINEETAAETIRLVREAGGEMEALYPLDLTSEVNAHDLAEFAAETFGGIDILVNSAMQMRLGAVEDLTVDDWKFTLDNTLMLQFLVTKHVVPHLRERGGGRIVFIASISGTDTGAGYPGNLGFLLPYACAKAGVLRMALVLANELAEIGVRVNSISPGTVGTEQGLAFYGEPGSEARRVSELGTLVPRLGDPEDIAKAALFLASEESAWVTGQNLIVDGGFVASGGMGIARAENRAAMAPVVGRFSVVDDGWETSGQAKTRS
jgi:NAD(P)-dependent dehydrogenase (short-subunit alcohol dehydrogenase family)